MKTIFGCAAVGFVTLIGFSGQAQDVIAVPPPPPEAYVAPAIVYQTPVVYQAPVIYQAPVLYQAPVIYQAPVLYQAPVVYAPAVQTYGAVEVPAPTATIVYVGGPCPRVENYYNNCASSPVIYFGGHQARREGYNFSLPR